MESKLGNSSRKRKRDRGQDDDDSGSDSGTNSTSSSSDDEDEDDVGELATEALDTEIQAALSAIRTKDPRVYDADTRFYSEIQDDSKDAGQAQKKPPEMYLRDYHREVLLSKGSDNGDVIDNQQMPYSQEQEALKKSIVGEINAATAEDQSSKDDGSESDQAFLSRKEKPRKPKRILAADLDVENADKDPDTFLSNFMSSRAWVPNAESRFQPFESDEEEDDRRAEEFEEAYNFRFEDPEMANEKLVSYARDANQRHSVRRSADNARKRRREQEKHRKEIEKQELAEEHARLKKLKIEELTEKVRKIRRAAGMKGQNVEDRDWARFVNGDWDDSHWEVEMQKRFGEEYYADSDFASGDEVPESLGKKHKLKKPKWDDEININDLVPDFDTGQDADFNVSETEPHNGGELPGMKLASTKGPKRKPNRKEEKKHTRKDRYKIEELADEQLKLEPKFLPTPSGKANLFRYRDTSPSSFGLSAREILMAEDAQLNQYAGLKKLATFRDSDKKRKDQKHLGKKARLRKWRKDTFGDENGPRIEEDLATVPGALDAQSINESDEKKGKRKRRASRKAVAAPAAD